MTGEPVRAAGCVLWRRNKDDGTVEICLVHRPRYDDWSLPKGKLKQGESLLEAALREVLEETGHTCAPGPRLATTHYTAKGRPKEVTYWSAEATGGTFTRNKEVDRVAWLPPDQAESRLSHPQDRPLIRALVTASGQGR
ncbi:NUDIX hydrolase [Streptomyces sp. MUM 203J]|uniref:NUDIX hydrolase n=1 Tax=Streptomyces sp. MUM 203J TaxID=2791990 RepID=UPI001F03411E|nr:NUDIX hydrolase [Streptomyces sp. MUM 203J]MCH0538524.1 NUDIX hydrolase [Streptomyces sp. MUM 203J]